MGGWKGEGRRRDVASRRDGGKEGEKKEGRKVETVNINVIVNVKSCPLCQPAKHGKKVNVRSQ